MHVVDSHQLNHPSHPCQPELCATPIAGCPLKAPCTQERELGLPDVQSLFEDMVLHTNLYPAQVLSKRLSVPGDILTSTMPLVIWPKEKSSVWELWETKEHRIMARFSDC